MPYTHAPLPADTREMCVYVYGGGNVLVKQGDVDASDLAFVDGSGPRGLPLAWATAAADVHARQCHEGRATDRGRRR